MVSTWGVGVRFYVISYVISGLKMFKDPPFKIVLGHINSVVLISVARAM